MFTFSAGCMVRWILYPLVTYNLEHDCIPAHKIKYMRKTTQSLMEPMCNSPLVSRYRTKGSRKHQEYAASHWRAERTVSVKALKNTKTSHEMYTLPPNINFVDKFMYENVNNVNKFMHECMGGGTISSQKGQGHFYRRQEHCFWWRHIEM